MPDALTYPLAVGGLGAAYFLDRSNFNDHLIGLAAGFASFAGLAWIYRQIRSTQGGTRLWASSNAYDAKGQFATTSTNALGQSESWTYDPKFGVPLSQTGPNGLTTS